MEPIVRRAVIAMAVAGVVGTGAFALAQGTPPPQRPARQMMMHRGPGGPGGPGSMMGLGRLNLTEDQRAAVQRLRDSQSQAHQGTLQKVFEVRKQLRDAIFADNGPDEAAIAAAQSQLQSLEAQMAANRLNMQKEIAKILTPEQRKQLRDMRAGPGGPRMRGRGMGRGMMMHGGF